MTDQDDDSAVFEINDYTVVTPMEQFITTIEGALVEWELTGNKKIRTYTKAMLPNWTVESRTKVVKLPGGNQFLLTYFFPQNKETVAVASNDLNSRGVSGSQLLTDLGSNVYDLSRIHPVTTMFGVSEFIILTPCDPEKDRVTLEDDLEWIRSALQNAAQDCQCYIPMFVEFGAHQKKTFFGVGLGPETFTTFESSFLYRGQRQHLHLSGVLSLFKNKVACPTIRDQGDIRTSVMFEYRSENLPERGNLSDDVVRNPGRLDLFAHGSSQSTISNVSLLALWPNQSEDVVNESSTYTDLDHLSALEWQFRIEYLPAEGNLVVGLEDLFAMHMSGKASNTVKQELGIRDTKPDELFPRQQDRLFITSEKKQIQRSASEQDFALLPLEEDVVNKWVDAIFQFANDVNALPADLSVPISTIVQDLFTQSNTTSYNCVTSRLARAFHSLSNTEVYQKHAQLHLWHAFVKMLRQRYDRGEDVYDDRNLTEPNLLKGYLHQKIEMLQCCMSARRQRFALYNGAQKFGDDDDDFFDATVDTFVSKKADAHADGRLAPHEDLMLLYHPEVPLYTFVTQNAAPMTEDMIMAHQQYLEGLTDEERLSAQLSSLISDIQAFKAANPDGHFHDFVRWHSPKDWDSENNCLSERFSNNDNLWLKCWEEACPMAVVNQPRLFNETTVAEEILYKLENATLANVAEWLLPSMVTCASAHLIVHSAGLEDIVDPLALKDLCVKLGMSNKEGYEKVFDVVNEYEQALSMYQSSFEIIRSFAKRCDDIPAPSLDMIRDLALNLVKRYKVMEDPSGHLVPNGVPIPGTFSSPMGSTIRQLMSSKNPSSFDPVFPEVFKKYYTARWTCVRPGQGSRAVPQRMFASFGNDDFRVAGSFTNDVLFA